MARPIPKIDLRDISKLSEPKSDDEKSFFDKSARAIGSQRSTNNLILARTPVTATQTAPEPEKPPDVPPPSKPPEAPLFTEKPAFLPPPKSISHSPKISPSSIPNPSPSVTTNKQGDGYISYGGYPYSIPGYSAFQPVSYQGMAPNTVSPSSAETGNQTEFEPFPKKLKEAPDKNNSPQNKVDVAKPSDLTVARSETEKTHKNETDSTPKDAKKHTEMNITSMAQGSGATVTIPAQTQDSKKQAERFSLKTSIPISKIDMKCVNNTSEATYPNKTNKKRVVPFNPAFTPPKVNEVPRVEIQSNVVIKSAQGKDDESKNENSKRLTPPAPNNSISTLINAAEALSNSDSPFWKSEKKPDPPVNESKEFSVAALTAATRPIFNPLNDTKSNSTKPPDPPVEQKNQIVFIQNKTVTNPKMLLTISQPQSNPQVMLQRTNYDSKNLQTPSRLSSLNKKNKEDAVENTASSKVVALKRLHQENCDENDFENLITENQIYGNKIVVKEKSQGIQQEQDLKKINTNKQTTEKPNQIVDTKNVLLQQNFLYLSNVQFPANLMMIKNNPKLNGNTDACKLNNRTNINEINQPATNEDNNMSVVNESTQTILNSKNIVVSKDIHVLKSNNNIVQAFPNKQTKTDLVFQTNQKVIMSPQILYQVPMLVDTESQKLNSQTTFLNQDYTKFLTQNKKELPMVNDQTKGNDKLFIACPYQMETKLQPKIVITNLRPKVNIVEEVSSLDVYEKRRRQRRHKYLSHREKEVKTDNSKRSEKPENFLSIITPDKMKEEICKEIEKIKAPSIDSSSDSDTDFEEFELKEYENIIEMYSEKNVVYNKTKIDFLAQFSLGTHEVCKEKLLEKRERSLLLDAVASACIAAGRIDKLTESKDEDEVAIESVARKQHHIYFQDKKDQNIHKGEVSRNKLEFFNHLQLVRVSRKYKEDYEKSWTTVVNERKRRNGISIKTTSTNAPQTEPMDLDTKGQLEILTKIKKCVNENNNLIKMRFDSDCEDPNVGVESNTIHALAEKNFTELSKLSQMADRSVKLFSGNSDTKKRDLNPGFDSENILKPHLQQPIHGYQSINVPNISKIISLKTAQEPNIVNSTQATSMDEPQNSAAGHKDERMMETSKAGECVGNERIDVPQTPETWPGLDAVMKSYRQFEIERKKEIAELQRRNTQLRVDCALANRKAARDTELVRALLAERQTLASDEHSVRSAVNMLLCAVEFVRNYQ